MTNSKIAATDAQIDRLVYDLYGLTDPTRCVGVLRKKRSRLWREKINVIANEVKQSRSKSRTVHIIIVNF